MTQNNLKTLENWKQKLFLIQTSFKNQVLSCVIINYPLRWMRISNNSVNALLVLFLLTIIIWILVWTINRIAQFPLSALDALLLFIMSIITSFCFWIIKVMHDITLGRNIENIVNLPTEEKGARDIYNWFKTTFKLRYQILFSIAIGILGIISAKIVSKFQPILVNNIGLYTGIFFSFFGIGNGMYCAAVIPTLTPTTFKNRIHLYPYDPSNSNAVKMFTSNLGKLSLACGFVGMVVMVLIFTIEPWNEKVTLNIALVWLIIGWSIIFYSFIFPIFCINKAISREKKEQIKKIEMLIKTYHDQIEQLSNNDINKLNILIELRNRIQLSKDTALDFNAWKKFLSSLMLPLISFFAGAFKLFEIINDFFKK